MSAVRRRFVERVRARIWPAVPRIRPARDADRSAPALSDGLVLLGSVWPGDGSEPVDGVVVVDGAGVVVRAGSGTDGGVDDRVPRIGGGQCWIGPAVADACVVRSPAALGAAAGPVSDRRVVGGTIGDLRRRRGVVHRGVVMTGPWIAGGVPVGDGIEADRLVVDGPARGRAVVHRLAAEGCDALALDLDADPSPYPPTVRAMVDTAHRSGLVVLALALRASSVARALDCGVDEFLRCPVERLPDELVERIATDRTPVTSTLQAFFSAGRGREAALNAAALVEAGAVLRYGTFGSGEQVDPRELDRMADAGLGRLGALRAATRGWRTRPGRIEVGRAAELVVLPADPLVEPGAWRVPLHVSGPDRPVAVQVGGGHQR